MCILLVNENRFPIDRGPGCILAIAIKMPSQLLRLSFWEDTANGGRMPTRKGLGYGVRLNVGRLPTARNSLFRLIFYNFTITVQYYPEWLKSHIPPDFVIISITDESCPAS